MSHGGSSSADSGGTGCRLCQLFAKFLVCPCLHHRLAFVLRHDPTLLHSDAKAALHAAKLTALSVRQGNEAITLMTALKVQVVVVLNGATEKSFARVARQAAKVVAFGNVTTHAAILDSVSGLVVCRWLDRVKTWQWRHLLAETVCVILKYLP